jgi:predicted RNA-binding Zn ribbon-like protein
MVEEQREALHAAIARLPKLVAGKLCLDFANTIEPRGRQVPNPPPGRERHDHLPGYTDLIAWAHHAGIVDEPGALGLLAHAAARPSAAAVMLARAEALREAIYRIFSTLAEAGKPRADDLALVTDEYAAGAAHAILNPASDGFIWSWVAHDNDLARPLWPLAWSAAALLTEGDLPRVKVCPGTPDAVVPCAWLFYDATKNRIRHWCSMADCGTKSKARRQTGRRRATRAAGRG